ncbi:CRTAC1 family protein [Thioalkalivibrio sp. XN8]|uniref:CRTAC1 family protein n=1 Tax=Thioalkalivibrio sp. XN8 TaxID=2712863 RepID=UPI0013EC50F6|nr:CRTAC1 family protein [Thioalkalivibrio sp. XN8]NGP54404.1 CRTAC1 family protein [Thioalkalivibrio sp. XN8]
MNRPSRDAAIGVAFRRSLVVIGVVAAVALVVVLVRLLGAPPPPEIPEADVDLSGLLANERQPTPTPAQFRDITRTAGIDFVHQNGARGDRMLPETMGGGVAWLDFDNDGDQDLLFVNSDTWPFARDPAAPRPRALYLYRNDGTGRFSDVADEAGLGAAAFYGQGVAVADFDADGWTDLFVTAVGENRLYRNLGGKFVDVSAAAGVAGGADTWSTSAGFFDHDGDGWLDLFVVNYVQWSREIDLEVDYRLAGVGRAYGPPTNFRGTQSYLYRNNRDGTFTETGAAAGIHVSHAATGQPVGKGLALVLVDFDEDGDLDVVVANDTVRNFVFLNHGDGTFEEIGIAAGAGFDRNGLATGAMGIDAAYFRNDDALAVAIGNFANEMSSFFVAAGGSGQFSDETIIAGIGPASRAALTFGVLFLDYDLDGRLDFLQANGHVENEINRVQAGQQYRQPAQLFWNCGAACRQPYVLVPPAQTMDLAQPIVGRGAAHADLDGDGRLDLVLTQAGGAPLLLRNETPISHRWLRLQLVGRAPNTHAIGAEVRLEGPDGAQRRTVNPTRSYLSQVELPLTFGLGAATSVGTLTIRWPDGTEQVLQGLEPDRLHVIHQP